MSVRRSVGPSVGPSVRPSRVIFRRVLGASCAVYPALLDATTQVVSVRRSVGPFFRVKSHYESRQHQTMSDDEEVASDVPQRCLFLKQEVLASLPFPIDNTRGVSHHF